MRGGSRGRERAWIPARLLPAAWAVLALAGGPAAAAALDGWSAAPRALASGMLWSAWAGVLLATLVPRPVGLVGLRIAAPAALALALAAAPSAGTGEAVAATTGAGLVTWVALGQATGFRFVNGAAYGDERRFPLRVPPGLLLGPAPLAAGVVVAGLASGPLLLADGRAGAGAAATLAGFPPAAAALRSLFGLSQRWAVLVPAGIVLKDPLTLVDPVLFLRDRVVSLRPLPFPAAPAADVVDLRLGAARGSLVLELTGEAPVLRSRGRHRGGETVGARRLAFSPTDAAGLLAEAKERRTAAAG